jgi:serine protease inhibitor
MGHYYNDGLSTSLLGSSLWLQEKGSYHQQTADVLANYYYASVFRGDLGSEEMNAQLRQWVNQQTGGLLEDSVKNLGFSADTVLALASTIYFTAGWENDFPESRTQEAVFHAPDGDISCEFLNETTTAAYYYAKTLVRRRNISGEAAPCG